MLAASDNQKFDGFLDKKDKSWSTIKTRTEAAER
jgi:hypothetical protein